MRRSACGMKRSVLGPSAAAGGAVMKAPKAASRIPLRIKRLIASLLTNSPAAFPSPLAGEGGDPRSGEGEGAAAEAESSPSGGLPLTFPSLRDGTHPLPQGERRRRSLGRLFAIVKAREVAAPP